MWSALVSRREVFELFLGSTKAVEGKLRETSQLRFGAGSETLLVWDCDPTQRFLLPSLMVVADDDVQSTLSAIAAAPQAPSPVTALTRILTREEATQQFDDDLLTIDERVFPALTALAFVEAVLHGGGRVGIRQLTPLICRRTLAFAWGRTLASRAGGEAFLELPARWLDVYSLLNSPSTHDTAQYAIDPIVSVLGLLTQIALGRRPETTTGALAYEILNGTQASQELAWEQLAAQLSRQIRIDALQSLTREERGSYLQEALRQMSSSGSYREQGDMAAACAFLATRLAPGSLEHLEILKGEGRPDLLAWYGLFAALQSPKEILSLYGGLGFRSSRDMLRVEDKLASPSADISYSELKILARGGLELLSSRIGHSSELQVELVPYVSTSFTFQLKNRARPKDAQQFFNMEASEPELSSRARLARIAVELSNLARELPDFSEESYSAKRSRRKL
ncbi:hypothetical protein [Comamonas testosteroni]|uniref:Uncharacterized protein n=1 Tax=Comamonas testosteroni TaxID=285 RepID=A0A096H1E3_COMTE|nr:hypothetical protein [Comamonas testosteroni]KGH31245.1 hypothetical protein P353_06805 [Comamonas testosteroni]